MITAITNGETIAGIPGTALAQAFQPTSEGVSSTPTLFFYKVGDRRYGYPFWEDYWDEMSETIIHKEIQTYESTFQLSALASQNPVSPGMTASDILNLAASILQSSVTVQFLQANDLGIERITDVRNSYFLDDRQQNEANPSFDFVIVHKQVIQTTTPVLQEVDIGLYSI